MASVLMGGVLVGLGAVFIWRSRTVTRQAKQYRDSGVVIAAVGAIIVVVSLIALAKGSL